MGRYKRIVRKKEDKGGVGPHHGGLTLMDRLYDNWEKAAAGLAALVLLAAAGYGVHYYRDSRSADIRKKLFEAASSIPSEGASMAHADAAITAIRDVIAKGGPDQVIVQARITLAAALARKGDTQGAAQEYSSAAAQGKGSLLGELAMAGEANTLMELGKAEEAAAKFEELYRTSNSYPKQDALFGQAMALAQSGKKKEAAAALNKLKGESPAYLSNDFLDDTLRRIEVGELSVDRVSAPAAASPAQAAPAALVGKENVHGAN
ncbi:MAG: tetratricopeptide repeat protein [Nitrospinae bacterium]|nr:tetratricopeptide repeat protein [Nitrospinota bacterium]